MLMLQLIEGALTVQIQSCLASKVATCTWEYRGGKTTKKVLKFGYF